VVPKPASVEDEEPAPVSPVSAIEAVPASIPRSFAESTTTLTTQEVTPDIEPEKTVYPGSVAEIQRGFEELLISGRDSQTHPPRSQASFAAPPPCCAQPARELPNTFHHPEASRMNNCSSTEIPATRDTATRDKWLKELACLSAERQSNRNSMGSAASYPVFSVFCNNCQASIPDVHYHCGTCDDGDFDLCQSCVDSGVGCGSEEHWMIKRFVKNGKVINSTTERIPPKEKAAALPVVPTAIQAQDSGLIIATRTCNSCIQGMSYYVLDDAVAFLT
jgi:next-to-BRCA1 protein 1